MRTCTFCARQAITYSLAKELEMDDVVEAFEWKDGAGRPFLLAVQWHPERMDQSAPLAGTLFERFLAASRASLLSAQRLFAARE